MYYYGIDFNATEELAKVWGTTDIGFNYGCTEIVLAQTFYVKSVNEIKTKEQMKDYLLENFKPSEEYNYDLVNCIEPATANEIYDFWEIDGDEFESSCGVPA